MLLCSVTTDTAGENDKHGKIAGHYGNQKILPPGRGGLIIEVASVSPCTSISAFIGGKYLMLCLKYQLDLKEGFVLCCGPFFASCRWSLLLKRDMTCETRRPPCCLSCCSNPAFHP